MIKVDFGNHVSGQSSALVEFGNMVANLKSAKTATTTAERNEYFKQAAYSALLGIGNIASNITPEYGASNTVNGINAVIVGRRLYENVNMAIQEHRDGKVNINRFQNILADIYTLAGGGSIFADKDKNGKLKGSMPAWGIPLAIAGDVIAAKAIQTGDTGYMSTEDFYNFDNWKGFAGELAEDWSRWVYDWLPDSLNPWKQLNRDGKYRVYDPITLDLNGDGIKALATNGFAGALFDHDNDGIRTATGWVGKDDGLLVRDLNGNGIIDNGSELFGDNTALSDGSKAAHGYIALAELDSNSDGKVDALDSAFNELKVWIDANSDGISQENELRTLMDLDIQSLDVAYQDANQNLGNGNSIRQLGILTKTDGTTAQMGDAWFAVDKLYSRFTDKVELTAEQAKAANDERYFQAA